MQDFQRLILNKKSDSESSINQAMIKKGILVRRDRHFVGSFKCELGGTILLETTVLTLGKGVSTNRNFGLCLSYYDDEGDLVGADNIDYDEINEITEVIDLMIDLSKKLISQICENTEVKYHSKEGTFFGFYQNPNEQQFFISTDDSHKTAFININKLIKLKEYFLDAKSFLIENGAAEED